jgi:hypothetical protein
MVSQYVWKNVTKDFITWRDILKKTEFILLFVKNIVETISRRSLENVFHVSKEKSGFDFVRRLPSFSLNPFI